MALTLDDNAGSGKTAMSDQQVLMSHDDAEMIRRKHLWPNGDKLPLKNVRRKEKHSLPFDNLGFLLAEDKSPPYTIYVGLMYQPIEDLPAESYATVEAILADGWIVD